MAINLKTRIRMCEQLLPPEKQPDLICTTFGSSKKIVLPANEAFSMISDGLLKTAKIIPNHESKLAQICAQLINNE